MKTKLVRLVSLAALAGSSIASAGETVYDWTWSSGSDGTAISASGTLDVLGNEVQSATGTISGGGLTGGAQSLTLVTAATPGVSAPDGDNLSTPGSFVFKTSVGDNLEGDTVFNSAAPYMDEYGLVFSVGSSTNNYGFNIWGNSPTSYQGNLAGNDGSTRIFISGDEGTFTATPVPLPAALPLLLSALVGMGLMGRRRDVA